MNFAYKIIFHFCSAKIFPLQRNFVGQRTKYSSLVGGPCIDSLPRLLVCKVEYTTNSWWQWRQFCASLGIWRHLFPSKIFERATRIILQAIDPIFNRMCYLTFFNRTSTKKHFEIGSIHFDQFCANFAPSYLNFGILVYFKFFFYFWAQFWSNFVPIISFLVNFTCGFWFLVFNFLGHFGPL